MIVDDGVSTPNVLSGAIVLRSTSVCTMVPLCRPAVRAAKSLRSMSRCCVFYCGMESGKPLALWVASAYAVWKYSVWMPCYAALPHLLCRCCSRFVCWTRCASVFGTCTTAYAPSRPMSIVGRISSAGLPITERRCSRRRRFHGSCRTLGPISPVAFATPTPTPTPTPGMKPWSRCMST